jgi:hypothetical protein
VTARRVGGALLAAIALLALASAPAHAQQHVGIAPELRIDVIGTNPTSVQGAAGVQIPTGTYVRIGVLAGAGATIDGDDSPRAAGRLDVLARFLFDPFRQSRWGFSAGAGVSLRADPGDRCARDSSPRSISKVAARAVDSRRRCRSGSAVAFAAAWACAGAAPARAEGGGYANAPV